MPRLTSSEIVDILNDFQSSEDDDLASEFDSNISGGHTWCNVHQRMDCSCDELIYESEWDSLSTAFQAAQRSK